MQSTLLTALLVSLPIALAVPADSSAAAPATSQAAALIVPAGGLHPDAAAQAAHASALSACISDATGRGVCEQTAIGYNPGAASYLAELAPDATISAALASLTVENSGPTALSAMLGAVAGEPSALQGLASSILGHVASLQGPVSAQATGGNGGSGNGNGGSAASASSTGAAPRAIETGIVMGMAGVAAGIAGLVVRL